jgi:nucleotide-binding universal stress UspA family protein
MAELIETVPPAAGLDPPIDQGVVVGVDGSASDRQVLAWAWREAVARDLPLHVVRAWTLAGAIHDAGAPAGVVPSLNDCADAIRGRTADLVADLAARADPPADPAAVVVHVVHGPAHEVMATASAHADVMVVGHRGRGRLSLVLGSVTEHVLHRARCPVVVIPLDPE